jgi:probable phosphoglycerate mutase
MAVLASEARALIGPRPVTFEWIPRAENARADAVANRAMDAQASFRA